MIGAWHFLPVAFGHQVMIKLDGDASGYKDYYYWA
jgi:hypothetical protein